MPAHEMTLPLIRVYQDFADLIQSLSDDLFLSPMNGWAPRDIVAHLIGWNRLMVESSSTILAGKSPAYYEDAPNDYNNVNARFVAKYASTSKQELLVELKSSLEDFEAFILALPPRDLVADHGVSHYSGGSATVSRIVESLAGDYRHHTCQIREWLNHR